MPLIDTSTLKVIERLPGWYGRYFDTDNMTFAYYDFDAGAAIQEHFHPNEEVWNVIDGQLEMTLEGVKQVAGAGAAVVVPANAKHSARAVSKGRAIVVDYPVRK
jgi:unsaturated pyranuronate lyase